MELKRIGYWFIGFGALFLMSGSIANAARFDKTDAQEPVYAAAGEDGDAVSRYSDGVYQKQEQSLKRSGWYLRMVTTATAPNGKRFEYGSGGIFGQLSDSRWKKDRHDIPSYGSAVLQTVFVQAGWEDVNEEYFSDYRHYFQERRRIRRGVWTFQVKNQTGADLSNASLQFTLDGPYDVFYTKEGTIEQPSGLKLLGRLKLVDVDNQKVYRYSQLASAALSMDGKHTRTFRWVLGKVRAGNYLPLNTVEAVSSGRRKAAARGKSHALPAYSYDKFGLPPE